MLKKRVIPTLLWKGSGLVKGVSFDSWRRVGTVMPAIKVYNMRQVDELILMDISATAEERDIDLSAIEEFANECFVPLTVGGGIRSLEQIRGLLRAGADKVCINSFAYENPDLVHKAAGFFGAQCIVVGVDVRRDPEKGYRCYSHNGSRPTTWTPEDWVVEMEKAGAGEILLTSVENDGTMKGYDLGLIQRIAGLLTVPLIASGGAGNYEDMLQALHCGADAVAAASIFTFTEQTPMEAKRYLKSHGIQTRCND